LDKPILARYNTTEEALRYNQKFNRRFTEKVTDWFEQRLLENILESLPKGGSALDVPCGCARLFPIVRARFDRVVEADWSFGMVQQSRANIAALGHPAAAGFVRVTALDLPFRDGTFDLALSVRLSHHIRLPEERARHIREVLRVARRSAVFTYFDHHSVKARMRRAQRMFRPEKREKWTVRRDEIESIAAAMGWRLLRTVPLSRFFSGHRYAVLERAAS
jgi:ubiquinone/menaquinone biosynthesis C-methylase UbiE